MKYTKIAILCLFLLTSIVASAKIEFRTAPYTSLTRHKIYTPRFDIEATKHNVRIEKASSQQYNHRPASYLTDEIYQQGSTNYKRQSIYSTSNESYYRRYTPTQTSSQTVAYHQHTSIKAYNPANNQPFDGGEPTVTTGFAQYAYGPPDKGPIGDVIFPLLLFIGIYILKLRNKN